LGHEIVNAPENWKNVWFQYGFFEKSVNQNIIIIITFNPEFEMKITLP